MVAMRWGALGFLVAFVLAGCASLDARTPTTTPSTSTTPAVARLPTGGADAAPGATPGPAIFDASQQAADNFKLWIEYESSPALDPAKQFEQHTYPDGVSVSARTMVGAQPSAIQTGLQGKGWSGTGAAAVIKAALQALCPDRNPGYRTAFDRSVASAQYVLRAELPWTGPEPGEYQVGWFAKLSCAHLRQRGIDGFEALLHSHRVGAANAAAQSAQFVQAVGSDDLRLRRATGLVVRQVCIDQHQVVRYHWQLA